MGTDDRSLWITFNGEIYNFQELRRTLEDRGTHFRSGTDTEVLLELYRLEGPSFLPKLRGMFAFALWDDREQTLLLARDPFGIKPLYLIDDGRSLRFASQVKALLAAGDVDTSLSSVAQTGFLLWGHVPEPYTLYQSIRSLPAGQAMTVKRGGQSRTWMYDDPLSALAERGTHAVLSESNGHDLSHTLKASLETSVRYHMVADVPVGCFLSSGIDSNVLAAIAAQHLSPRRQLQCITLGFEEYLGTEEDEVPLAAECAQRLGVGHHVRMVSSAEFQGDLERLLCSMDQPSIDGVNTYFVAKVAAEFGLKVAISGLGADEMFGGYPTFWQVPRAVLVAKLIPFAASLGPAIRDLIRPLVQHLTSPKYASALEYGASIGGAYFLRRGLFMPWELTDLLDADTVRSGLESLALPDQLDSQIASIETPHARVMALEVLEFLRPRLLRDSDWAGMAHSLEIRTPYVDAYLFREIATLLDSSAKRPSKLDLAACSPTHLPASMGTRPKTGFNVPVRSWLPSRPGPTSKTRGLRGWATLLAEQFKFDLQAANGPA